jgi:putative ABC transport system ATP-binding protein
VTTAAPVLDMAGVTLSLAKPERRKDRFDLHLDRFVAYPGEAIALVGPSGAGKSTLLNLIGLAQRPDRAATFVLRPREGAQHDLVALWSRNADRSITDIRARHQGYVLQQGGLLPFLDVRANIAIALGLAGRCDPEAVERIAGELGIEGLLERRIGEVSVGQRQRIAIARALVHGPEIILADEPTANVHPSMADDVLALLRRQAERHGALLLMATHDVQRAAAFGFDFVRVKPCAALDDAASLSSVSRPPRG